jgi:hypothetical protein
MNRRILHLPLAALLFTALCAVGQAVAVPPELLQQEGPVPQEVLYGAIFMVFVLGIVLGVWIQKRMQ